MWQLSIHRATKKRTLLRLPLVARPLLPPPLLVAGILKKITFVRLPLAITKPAETVRLLLHT